MLKRFYFTDRIADFIDRSEHEVLGHLADQSTFAIEATQRDAWLQQIRDLKAILTPYRGRGTVYFEYAVPRLGKRIDVVLLIDHVVFVLEFKVGERGFPSHAIDQVWDYAVDLKNFHDASHDKQVAPVLVATLAPTAPFAIQICAQGDGVLWPVCINSSQLASAIEQVLDFCDGPPINPTTWEAGRYSPTPTIVEAAMALYAGHAVADISRNDASATNLARTTEAISTIINDARHQRKKSLCLITGVPGAGKTLVGLNIANQHTDKNSLLYSVYLSGNGPLVDVLREALARDEVQRGRATGNRIRKGEALSRVKQFIQNVHHFRDECLIDSDRPPIEHVAIFDGAQRAWNLEQTASFMQRKKQRPDFSQSEPEFLISCLDRHTDWAVVACLVGGGQEINTGEAGIGEWIDALDRSFPDWCIHVSPCLNDEEYGAGAVLATLKRRANVDFNEDLHLAVSMRSFRAEHVSALVKHLLGLKAEAAQIAWQQVRDRYPIVLTRDLHQAKRWLRDHARGSERYGMVVSSQAQRLRPYAIDVRTPMDPVHWFLDPEDDVRSSYYLEDVATEFQVQGLELDWACVIWDADFQHTPKGWQHHSFVGTRWNRINKPERQNYLKNAYRVLLTRARQGMVIVVPEGDPNDPTRSPGMYEDTFRYLASIGFPTI